MRNMPGHAKSAEVSGPARARACTPRLMYSVCIDLFRLPPVTHEGEKFDTLAVCVDRHSGWIIAVPCLDKGLTGAKLAKMMLKEWRFFGIPSIVMTDQGSHFTSEWWKTFCAELGIRQAYAHAYHHQANGRAEVAGQQIKELCENMSSKMNKHGWRHYLWFRINCMTLRGRPD